MRKKAGKKEIIDSFMRNRGSKDIWHIFGGIDKTVLMPMYCDVGLYYDEIEKSRRQQEKDICVDCLKKRNAKREPRKDKKKK